MSRDEQGRARRDLVVVDARGLTHASILVEEPVDEFNPTLRRVPYLVALCAYLRAVDEAVDEAITTQFMIAALGVPPEFSGLDTRPSIRYPTERWDAWQEASGAPTCLWCARH